MSASEDSEVVDRLDSSSNFTSLQPAQTHTLPRASGQLSDSSGSDNEPLAGFLPDNDNDGDSNDSFLPSNDNNRVADAEPLLGQHDPANLVDPFAAEDSYYLRPNRYYGPASTWRSWTKEDRDVAESLDVERAHDLSIHLYNAHALRFKTQRLQDTLSRRRRRGTSAIDDDETCMFAVPKVWTAWPMPPDEVPHNHVTCEDLDMRPSKEIEECLISITARAARIRWHARDWENGEQVKEQALAERRDQQTGALSEIFDELAPELPVPSSQAIKDNDDSSSESSKDAFDNDLYGSDAAARPVPLVDDDKARRLLLPSTRHVISQLDHLLMALHRARQSYARPISTDEDDTSTSSPTDGEPKSSGSSKRRRRSSRAHRVSSIMSVDKEASLRSSSTGRNRSVSKNSSRHRNRKAKGLGLRDWSDVLGMAALAGWNEDIVARASERCAELFGENMLFRRFHEAGHQEEKSCFTERLASGEEPPDSENSEPGPSLRAQDTDEADDSNTDAEPESRFPCPVESCPRHKTPFRTAGNLKQHMTHNHAQFEEGDDENGILQAAMRDRRQVFCPVQTCGRSREPFSKGSKLYLHLRKMHPEINVQDLKRLESQRMGEARGKWTGEKRKKNPYERSRLNSDVEGQFSPTIFLD